MQSRIGVNTDVHPSSSHVTDDLRNKQVFLAVLMIDLYPPREVSTDLSNSAAGNNRVISILQCTDTQPHSVFIIYVGVTGIFVHYCCEADILVFSSGSGFYKTWRRICRRLSLKM